MTLNYTGIPGQLAVLQTCSSVELPQQDVPPLSADVASLLDRCWVPPPHVTLQAAHAPQDAQEQSTDYGQKYL